MRIYTTMAPTPARVVGLARLLDGLGGSAPRRTVGRLFQPMAGEWHGAGEPDAFREVVQACAELGVIQMREDHGNQQLRLADGLRELPTGRWPVVLAERAFHTQPPAGENQFAVACGWLLAQPITGGPRGHDGLRQGLQRGGFDLKEVHLTTPTRIDMFLYWAKYLGLVVRVEDSAGRGVIPDPTAFLRRHLPQLLPDPAAMTATEFRRALGRLCPPLDGGEIRRQVLGKMRGAGVPARPDNQLSDALSLALRRLHHAGELHWTYPNDADDFLTLSRDERAAFFVPGPPPARS